MSFHFNKFNVEPLFQKKKLICENIFVSISSVYEHISICLDDTLLEKMFMPKKFFFFFVFANVVIVIVISLCFCFLDFHIHF